MMNPDPSARPDMVTVANTLGTLRVGDPRQRRRRPRPSTSAATTTPRRCRSPIGSPLRPSSPPPAAARPDAGARGASPRLGADPGRRHRGGTRSSTGDRAVEQQRRNQRQRRQHSGARADPVDQAAADTPLRPRRTSRHTSLAHARVAAAETDARRRRPPPPSSPPSSTTATSTAPNGTPTSGQLADSITHYYSVVPGDTNTGWQLLTPSYQQGTAGGRGSLRAVVEQHRPGRRQQRDRVAPEYRHRDAHLSLQGRTGSDRAHPVRTGQPRRHPEDQLVAGAQQPVAAAGQSTRTGDPSVHATMSSTTWLNHTR